MLSSLYSIRARRDADGFTLIELLVVVIIIGLLAAIALPIFIDQTRTAVDASVKSDVRNTVTNITNAQAQKSVSVKAAVSDAATSVALAVAGATTEVAIKGSVTLGNVPELGATYSVYGWNGNGKVYQGSSTNPGFTFSSLTGRFSQGTGAAPTAGATADSGSGSGSTGGSSASAPSWTTAAALPNATQGFGYSTTLAASGNPTPTYALATGSTLPTGLSLDATSGTISGTPTATGSFSFTVNAQNTTGSVNVVARTFSLNLLAPTTVYSWSFDSSSTNGFVQGAGTYEMDNGTAHNAYSSYKINGTSPTGYASHDLNSLTVGKTYSITGWVLKPSPTSDYSAIRVLDASGTTKLNLQVVGNGNWQKLGTATFTYAAGDTVRLVNSSTGSIYPSNFDDIVIAG